jgi:hypothetical protein
MKKLGVPHFSPPLREVGIFLPDSTQLSQQRTPKRQWKKDVSLNFWDYDAHLEL